ncbi:MarR family transcriptional regulator [Patulibacter sp. S7RM1-6]
MAPKKTGASAETALPPSDDVVGSVVETVKSRLEELRPYLEEAERLQAILAASEGRPAKPAEPRQRQGSNKRTIMAVVAQRPGVTAAEIARETGMKRTVIASTVSRLKRTGELEPEGRGVKLPGAAGTEA